MSINKRVDIKIVYSLFEIPFGYKKTQTIDRELLTNIILREINQMEKSILYVIYQFILSSRTEKSNLQ